jgi:hypothetical protein
MKYITATFVFLVFNASWQWWALMVAWMLAELFLLIMQALKEYKEIKEKKAKYNLSPDGKVMTKEDLESIWNNGYAVGLEHSNMSKH